jgi:Creatinine amidohydrolase.
MTNQAASKVFLEDLTSAELRAAMTRHPLVLLPLGSQEDQGAHAPMGDFRLAGRLPGGSQRRPGRGSCRAGGTDPAVRDGGSFRDGAGRARAVAREFSRGAA